MFSSLKAFVTSVTTTFVSSWMRVDSPIYVRLNSTEMVTVAWEVNNSIFDISSTVPLPEEPLPPSYSPPPQSLPSPHLPPSTQSPPTPQPPSSSGNTTAEGVDRFLSLLRTAPKPPRRITPQRPSAAVPSSLMQPYVYVPEAESSQPEVVIPWPIDPPVAVEPRHILKNLQSRHAKHLGSVFNMETRRRSPQGTPIRSHLPHEATGNLDGSANFYCRFWRGEPLSAYREGLTGLRNYF